MTFAVAGTAVGEGWRRGQNGARCGGVLTAVLLVGAACRSGQVEEPPAGQQPNVAPAALAAAAGAPGERRRREQPPPPLAPEPWHIPVGPKLAILPGQGLGPIRFGARIETIERLMQEPCEEKRQDAPHQVVCRYSAKAVDFFLTDGVVTKMQVHRLGRPFRNRDPKPDYGIFNGRFESGANFGMLMGSAQELLGKPKAVRKLDGTNPFGTVEVHEYEDFSIEYDRLQPERVVLGGVILNAPQRPRTASTKSK